MVLSEAKDTRCEQSEQRTRMAKPSEHDLAKQEHGTISRRNSLILAIQEVKAMKITTFNPQIISKDMNSIAELFEELGFEKKHNPTGIGDYNASGIRMADANGFHIDLSQGENMPIPQDVTVIRMNVDNFDEAYELLSSHGFKNFYEDKIVQTESFKSAIMISPSGFAFNVIEHIKK